MMTLPDSLRIVALEATNVKRLVAIRIEPKGHVVTLTGRNGAGKSSCLDAIAYALGGKALVPSEPIRRGETSASVTVDLGDLVVERRFTPTTSYLEVRGKDGARYPSPQTILDTLTGRLTFDPLEFMRETPKQQAEILLELAGLSEGLRKLEIERERVFAERTSVNRELKAAEARLAGAQAAADGTPDEEVSAAALLQELDQAESVRRTNSQARRKVEEAALYVQELQREQQGVQVDLEEARQRVNALEAKLEAATARTATFAAEVRKLDEAAVTLQDPDLGPIRERIAAVDQVNHQVRAKRARAILEAGTAALRATAAARTQDLEELETQRAQLLGGAAFPVQGLSVRDGQAVYNDVLLEQVSAAEQLRVSIEIGWALHPRLKVLLVKDGSLLDDDMLGLIRRATVERDAQLWIERVHVGAGEAAIIIEDGAVVEAEAIR